MDWVGRLVGEIDGVAGSLVFRLTGHGDLSLGGTAAASQWSAAVLKMTSTDKLQING